MLKFDLKTLAEKLKHDRTVTKRSMLKMITSLYDPLGLISQIMAKAKILFQDICREKIGWDNELPERYRVI